MKKTDVQKRILKNGEPLGLGLFSWDEKTKTFASNQNMLVIDFTGIDSCTITAGSGCTITAGSDCTITAGWRCTITAGSGCTITAGSDCTITAGWRCTITAGSDCTITAGWRCTITAGSDCTITAGSGCTITAGSDCTITAGSGCVFVHRYTREFFGLPEGKTIKTNTYDNPGYLTLDGDVWRDADGHECIVADGILSRVLHKRGDVYKVINHGSDKASYLVERDGVYSHGETVKQAIYDLQFKFTDRDTSEYENYSLDTVLSFADCVKMYRTITGACETGCKAFVESQSEIKESYTVSELIEKTEHQYGHEAFKAFFEDK